MSTTLSTTFRIVHMKKMERAVIQIYMNLGINHAYWADETPLSCNVYETTIAHPLGFSLPMYILLIPQAYLFGNYSILIHAIEAGILKFATHDCRVLLTEPLPRQ